MNDASLSHSPTPARSFEVSDERLAADLKKSPGNTPANHPVGELLDRHWEAVFSYARLCTHGVRPAGILTTASFTRLFGESLRQAGPTAAWRPQLLVTVRRIAAEWLMDQRRELLHPELVSGSDPEGRAAARLLPPEGRRLLSRAFQRLPEPARCLLWHMEAEAEQLDVPAALLGLAVEDAAVELGRARERLREGCLEIHRELAPEQECRRYSRMLDVSLRRGGVDLDPDLRRHMARCSHCRYAADQLNQFNGQLALPLAEAVLGWGARLYLDSRVGRATAIVEVTEPPGAVETAVEATSELAPAQGEFPSPAAAPRRPDVPPRTARRAQSPAGSRPSVHRATTHKAPRRAPRRRNVTLGVLTVSTLILVPLVLWAAGSRSEGQNGMAEGTNSSEAPGSGSGSDTVPGANPSWVGTSDQANGTGGRLRNTATGLCIGIVGKEPAKGMETELTSCTSKSAQRWTYEADGLLRDVAAPGLCLDSHLGYSVQLAACSGESQPGTKNVRYDFTLQGTLVPRWNQDLALAPASAKAEAALVLKLRKDEPAERWTLDTSSPSLQLEVVNWDSAAESTAPATPALPKASTTPSPTATPRTSATPTPQPTPSSAAPSYGYCSYPYDYYCQGSGQYGSGYDYGYGGYGSGYGGGQGGHR
ncbi:ricin-type beta-trefoil lectin domain protein [Streptomyces sp. NBC_01236]|uniref:ricin-type beta-trefoil lectin domain protein n=1 Tax=Streptomyces sp. NBC_01236 TaxID=2903789 RepID=UPI003FA3B85D|nr:ricin-type beta-trefoil lectin domain protein [Streptomyces sp. NBC_01236]